MLLREFSCNTRRLVFVAATVKNDILFRIVLISFVVLAISPAIAEAQRTKRTRTEDCLSYNQGMRVTANKDWPAAVELAEKNNRMLTTDVITLHMTGPDRFDASMAQTRAALDTEIAAAGECYAGSLFERIVLGIEATMVELEARAAPKREEWEAREARRLAREAAWGRVARELKVATSGSARVLLERIDVGTDTTLEVRVTNTHEGLILRPTTGRLIVIDEGAEGERATFVPVGFSLTDNFGNNFPLTSVTPELVGTEAGIHPAASRVFKVKFRDHAPVSATGVALIVEKGALGNPDTLRFSLPSDVFLPDPRDHRPP